MSLFNLQAIRSIATLDLPMVVDLIGIYGLKGPYCTLTATDWFLQALSVIPRGSWGDVVRRFTMIRWAVLGASLLSTHTPPPPPPRVAGIRSGRFDEENPFVQNSSVLLVQPDEGVSVLVVDRIGDYLPQSTEKSQVLVIPVGARHKCQQARMDSPQKVGPEQLRRGAAAARGGHCGGGGLERREAAKWWTWTGPTGPGPNDDIHHYDFITTPIADQIGPIDSVSKTEYYDVEAAKYGPFNPYIPIRSTTIGKSRVAIDPIAMHTSWRSNSDIASVTRDSMSFRVVRTNQYNQDLGLIHSTNGNHLESPNEGSSIDHQVTIHLHAQNITMFPNNETWYFASQILVSSSGGLILILTAQSTRN
ncbi:ent-kaur-16-ene synthase, chloroplastic [Dorcoceras hygrometricum]|uniref:Ent-kaur-16-ene synthase, chloroplastic n=1 Tax=Dorcoceras hygrometricum TaxID=472368 RepID=A0A2Z7D5T1_9LAMI|nr:ent-kaur-16-ene synthase, chloroplastic [Dorcoceras hygrometricum]